MTASDERDYRIISCNDHVVLPPDLFEKRLPSKDRERGPRVIEGAGGDTMRLLASYGLSTEELERVAGSGEQGKPGDAWTFDGEVYATAFSSAVEDAEAMDYRILLSFSYQELPKRFYDSAARLEVLDRDGIIASACFPMFEFPGYCGQLFLRSKDRELALRCVRAYNDFIIEEWAGKAPGRFIPVVVLPLWDARLSAAEIERTAAMGGRAITFPEDPAKLGLASIHDPDRFWDPVFSAAQQAGMPLCAHIGSSSWTPPPAKGQSVTVMLGLYYVLPIMTLQDWMLSDVFLRFPNLRLVLCESGIGWIPHALEHADYVWDRGRRWAGSKLPEPPSHYFRDHVFACLKHENLGARHIGDVGVDNCLMDTDYPHPETTFPNTTRELQTRLAHLTDDELRKVTRANAEGLFAFQPAESVSPQA